MIHGQCVVRVLSDFKIEHIIGVDDFTAGNAVLKAIYEMAVPPHTTGGVYTTEAALGEISVSIADKKNTLLLVKNPQTALALFRESVDIPKHLNIGPMSSRKNTKKATMYAYLSDDDISAIDEMASMGIRVYFNQTIEQKTEEWESIKTSMKR